MSLLVTPAAYLDESYDGYLLRIANLNGLWGINSLARVCGLGRTPLAIARRPVAEVAQALGTSPFKMPQPGGAHHRADGRRSQRTFVWQLGWPQLLRWCPECLEEAPYWRECWNSPFYPVCAVHGQKLRTACSRCGAKLRIDRLKLDVCKCGTPLCHGPRDPAEPRLVAFSAGLRGDDRSPSPLLAECRTLATHDQRYTLNWIVGRLLGLAPSVRQERIAYQVLLKSEGGRHFLANPDIFVEEAIYRLMKERRWTPLMVGLELHRLPAIIRNRFGSLIELMRSVRNCDPNPVGTCIYERIRAQGYATASNLAELFGRADATWQSNCERGFVRGAMPRRTARQTSWQVPLETVDELSAVFRRSLTTEEAAWRLRLSVSQVTGLIKLGVLQLAPFGRVWIDEADRSVEWLSAIAVCRPSPGRRYKKLAELELPNGPRRYGMLRKWSRMFASVFCGDMQILQTSQNLQLGFACFSVVDA